MQRLSWLGVACIALFVTSCATTQGSQSYPGDYRGSSRGYDALSFNGDWQVVTQRSDDPRDWADQQLGTGLDSRRHNTAWYLPDEIRIQGDRGELRIEDVNGGVLADLPLTRGRSDSYNSDAQYDRGASARWIGRGRLQVDRVNDNGRNVTQTFTLDAGGQQLVIGTQVQRRDGSLRTFTRVYQRTS